MASPKPNPPPSSDPDDFWTLPPDGSANVLDDARWERLLRLPGVIVHSRDDALADEPVVPIKTIGQMSTEELLRLLGRRPDDDWDDAWYEGDDDPPEPAVAPES